MHLEETPGVPNNSQTGITKEITESWDNDGGEKDVVAPSGVSLRVM
ncbi:MAG: hypothetical protein MK165_04355 [Pirellulaceae bacterium]|nr:hypothetical protein [Pirellulaceae bacterium]